jgi:N6-adenosine-specific RNA methylase IME4
MSAETTTFDWRAHLDVHPAADLFPLMDAERFAALVADIRAKGLLHPIVLCNGKILDGRHRYRACIEAGVVPKFIDYIGNPFDYAWSVNGQRRDLVAEQRAALWLEAIEGSEAWRAEQKRIAHTADEKRSEAQKGIPKADKERAATTCGSTSDKSAKASTAAAKASGTNRGAIERQQMLRNNRPDLAAKVRSGELKPNEAKWQMRSEAVLEKAQTSPPTGKYRVIYADPPWDYGNHIQLEAYGDPRNHYPTMSLAEICALPVRDIAEDDAVLFLWVTSPMLMKSDQVIESWGFTYKAAFVWDKVKHNMGYYNSVRHEFLLICTRGACRPDVHKLFDSVQSIERTKHSRKPVEFREIIDTLYPHGPRIELFQRADSVPNGWHVWGAEAAQVAEAALSDNKAAA